MKKRKAKAAHEINTFSKGVMAFVMFAFFWGVAIGTYAVIRQVTEIQVVLDYIIKLALPVGCGYFVKAFGENIFKIVFAHKLTMAQAGAPGQAQEEREEP